MNPSRIIPIGIDHLLIEYEEKIDPVVNATVSQLWKSIEAQNWPGLIAMIPAYRSLLVQFDPTQWVAADLEQQIRGLLPKGEASDATSGRSITLPVLYGGKHGPDLQDVAKYNNLTANQVIDIHQGGSYRVYMLGFNPGYPYLGGLDPRLAIPRLKQPRTRVPAGSVAIGGEQTGVYSTASPGGWRLIGHTPVPLFDVKLENPVLLRPGDSVRFRRVDQQEYDSIIMQIENGSYQIEMAGDNR